MANDSAALLAALSKLDSGDSNFLQGLSGNFATTNPANAAPASNILGAFFKGAAEGTQKKSNDKLRAALEDQMKLAKYREQLEAEAKKVDNAEKYRQANQGFLDEFTLNLQALPSSELKTNYANRTIMQDANARQVLADRLGLDDASKVDLVVDSNNNLYANQQFVGSALDFASNDAKSKFASYQGQQLSNAEKAATLPYAAPQAQANLAKAQAESFKATNEGNLARSQTANTTQTPLERVYGLPTQRAMTKEQSAALAEDYGKLRELDRTKSEAASRLGAAGEQVINAYAQLAKTGGSDISGLGSDVKIQIKRALSALNSATGNTYGQAEIDNFLKNRAVLENATGQMLLSYIAQTKGSITELENRRYEAMDANPNRTTAENLELSRIAVNISRRELIQQEFAQKYAEAFGRVANPAAYEEGKQVFKAFINQNPETDVVDPGALRKGLSDLLQNPTQIEALFSQGQPTQSTPKKVPFREIK